MTTYNETQQLQQVAAEFNRYSIRLCIVLSVIVSLAATVILSKHQLVSHQWGYVAALVAPISVTLFFRNRIVQCGQCAYVAALFVTLGAAVCFGF